MSGPGEPPGPGSGPAGVDGAPAAGAPMAAGGFTESTTDEAIPPEVLGRRICDFDLRIEGTPLGAVIERFGAELRARGITRLTPRFYLSDEWGVPEGTVAIGIPFYLADERLLRVQERRGGMVEGTSAEDILRYLRHEMGHVVNYAYRLYATAEWTGLFGPISRPYVDEYRAQPFSPEFVRHLPGGYAQKHPDEDWAETFAVWATPECDWRGLYGDSPGALKKLDYCERTLTELAGRAPEVTETELDVEAREIKTTVQEYYEEIQLGAAHIPRSLDGDLRAIFSLPVTLPAASGGGAGEGGGAGSVPDGSPRLGAGSALIRRQRDALAVTVYHWTGVDPDLVRRLVGHLAERAREMKLTYPLGRRDEVLVHLGAFVTTLAMNYVYKGGFIAS